MHEWLNDSYGCSTYVAKCKEAMVAGDHQKASESLNKAMAYHANLGPFS